MAVSGLHGVNPNLKKTFSILNEDKIKNKISRQKLADSYQQTLAQYIQQWLRRLTNILILSEWIV